MHWLDGEGPAHGKLASQHVVLVQEGSSQERGTSSQGRGNKFSCRRAEAIDASLIGRIDSSAGWRLGSWSNPG